MVPGWFRVLIQIVYSFFFFFVTLFIVGFFIRSLPDGS